MKFAVVVVFGLLAYVSGIPMTLLRKSTPIDKKFNVGDIWTDCSQPSDPFKIESVTITPDPPKKGQSVTVVASVKLGEQVTGGSVEVKAKFGIIPIYSHTFDLCTLLDEVNQKCPDSAGVHNATVTETIPSVVPGGHYTGQAIATDQNGKQLACIDFDIHL